MRTVRAVCLCLCLLNCPAFAQDIASFKDDRRADGDEAFSDSEQHTAQALAEFRSVVVETATRELSAMNKAGILKNVLLKEYPENFAGMKAEYNPDLRFSLRSVGLSKAEAKSIVGDLVSTMKVQDSLETVVTSGRSEKELRAAGIEISQKLQAADLEAEIAVSVFDDEMKILARGPQAVENAILSKRLDVRNDIKIEDFLGVTPTAETLPAGRRWQAGGGSCTTRFNVIDQTGNLGIITAGHCVDTGIVEGISVSVLQEWAGLTLLRA